MGVCPQEQTHILLDTPANVCEQQMYACLAVGQGAQEAGSVQSVTLQVQAHLTSELEVCIRPAYSEVFLLLFGL